MPARTRPPAPLPPDTRIIPAVPADPAPELHASWEDIVAAELAALDD